MLGQFELLTGAHDLRVAGLVFARQRLGEEIKVGLAQKGLEVAAQVGAQKLVGVGKAPLGILAEDEQRQVVHQRMVERLGRAHGRVRWRRGWHGGRQAHGLQRREVYRQNPPMLEPGAANSFSPQSACR